MDVMVPWHGMTEGLRPEASAFQVQAQAVSAAKASRLTRKS